MSCNGCIAGYNENVVLASGVTSLSGVLSVTKTVGVTVNGVCQLGDDGCRQVSGCLSSHTWELDLLHPDYVLKNDSACVGAGSGVDVYVQLTETVCGNHKNESWGLFYAGGSGCAAAQLTSLATLGFEAFCTKCA